MAIATNKKPKSDDDEEQGEKMIILSFPENQTFGKCLKLSEAVTLFSY
ncbi:MAG: hypothetical protein RMX96_22610 [Nostoc sp. ChiSLP02]|nr:hypothetical protein [Nostoc sp. ChiSLP02]